MRFDILGTTELNKSEHTHLIGKVGNKSKVSSSFLDLFSVPPQIVYKSRTCCRTC